jgi:hypothetical protein
MVSSIRDIEKSILIAKRSQVIPAIFKQGVQHSNIRWFLDQHAGHFRLQEWRL